MKFLQVSNHNKRTFESGLGKRDGRLQLRANGAVRNEEAEVLLATMLVRVGPAFRHWESTWQ